MKSTRIGAYLLAAAMTLSVFSCVKDEVEEVTPPPPPAEQSIGGKGGNATLKVIPVHKGLDIDSCTIYIAYNTLDTTQNYDDSMFCGRVDGGRPAAVFTNLKGGNYFLAAKGWDLVRSQKVSGVIAFTLDDRQIFHTVELQLGQ